MNLDLTDEQRLIRETARDFADREIIPRARDNDRASASTSSSCSASPRWATSARPSPRSTAGAALDYISYGLVVEEIGRGDSSARTVVSVQTSLVAGSIEQWGTEEQKQEILPKLCSGEWLGCFGLTEPGTGSDAASVATRATRKNGGWSISGSKMFISLGNNAKVAMIFAQTDPEKKHRGVACFLVPTDRPGLHARRRSTASSGCARPTPPSWRWTVSRSPTTRSWARSATGSRSRCRRSTAGATASPPAASGSRQGCVNESVKYSKERRQFDRPIASFQLVQELIAEMVVDTDAARLLVWRAGHLKDQKQPNTLETSIAKYYATEAAVRCANNAIQVHGGYGYIDEYPVERYMRDARVTTLYEGTSQIQKLIIGRHATGINALIPE